ncbi:MAG: permease [Puniceicoccaceae bacterium]
MELKKELKWGGSLLGIFLILYFLPVGTLRFDNAVTEALELTKWYAREHVLLCLIPAFWIAGAIAAFVSQGSVMRYLGPKAPKPLAYGVGAVSGTILAVCSCTVLPLFAGIYRMGAGLGPATAFLYSGPAINALAIIMTAKVLGFQLGLARALTAVVFSVVIGLTMAWLFRKEEQEKAANVHLPDEEPPRTLRQTSAFFATLIGILVFANWGGGDGGSGFFATIHSFKWWLSGALSLLLVWMIWSWFKRAELVEWCEQTWSYAKQIMPLLLGGVLVAGLLLGRPGSEGLIPSQWIAQSVGDNSIWANLFASVAGAFMYFATLTEIPILQGLMGNGMASGPSLALLLAGPALSLPNMLVINSVIGPRKTTAYVLLVVLMATLTGWVYGIIF